MWTRSFIAVEVEPTMVASSSSYQTLMGEVADLRCHRYNKVLRVDLTELITLLYKCLIRHDIIAKD